MRNAMALMIVALSMAMLSGQAVADSTASAGRGSGEVIIQLDGTITITVTRPITSGSCVPNARLKVRPHPNGRWTNLGKGHRTEEDNSYVWVWDWITFPYYRDGIYDWHVDISCGLGIEEGIVIVDNSDIDYPGYGDFPRSPAPPKEDDDPDEGSGGSGSTGGGWTDSGGGYTWNPGGTGDVSGGTSGNSGETAGGGNSTDGTTGGSTGNSGSTGGHRNGYGTTPLAYGTDADESDVSIIGKGDGEDGEATPLSTTVEQEGPGHKVLTVSRTWTGGGGGSCSPTATMKVRLKPSGDWTYLPLKSHTQVGGTHEWKWDWYTCAYDNGDYDTYSEITCNPNPPSPDTSVVKVEDPIVSDISGPEYVCVDTNATFTATTNPGGHESEVSWSGGETPATESGASFTTKWSTPGVKHVIASLYCGDKTKYDKTVTVCCKPELSTFILGVHQVKTGCGGHPDILLFLAPCSACPDSPTWTATGPLSITEQGFNDMEQKYYAKVHAAEPPAGTCEQSGDVTAQVRDCVSDPYHVTAKHNGPFTVTLTGIDTPVYYYGDNTFAELDLPVPAGCMPWDEVYGVLTTVNYEFCIGCPLPGPGPSDMYEELELGDGCSCGLGNEKHNNISASFSGCGTLADDIGILTCSCDSSSFQYPVDCKIKQSYWLDSCKISDQCIHETRSSSSGTCIGLTQSVSVSSGWSTCSCQ